MLSVVLLHRHDGAHGVCDVLSASVLHDPLMRIVGNDVSPRLAFHRRPACCSRRFTIFFHSL